MVSLLYDVAELDNLAPGHPMLIVVRLNRLTRLPATTPALCATRSIGGTV